MSYLFTSESVSEGHPDKIADAISDAVLDLVMSKEDPSLYRLKNRQTSETPYWGLEPRAKQKGQRQRRVANLRPITHQELEDHARRNLYPSPRQTASRALKIERERKRTQKKEAQTQTQKTHLTRVGQ